MLLIKRYGLPNQALQVLKVFFVFFNNHFQHHKFVSLFIFSVEFFVNQCKPLFLFNSVRTRALLGKLCMSNLALFALFFFFLLFLLGYSVSLRLKQRGPVSLELKHVPNFTRICVFAFQGTFVSSWFTTASVNDIYSCLFSPGNKWKCTL